MANTSSSASFGIWSQSAGAMAFFGTNPKQECRRVFRDGTNIHISQMGGNGTTFSYDQAPEAQSGIVVHDSIRAATYELHPKTWTPNLQRPWTSSIGIASLGEGLYHRTRLGTMKYYEQFGKGYRVRNITTDAIEETVVIFGSGSNISLPFCWVNNQTILAVQPDGKISLWDIDTQTTLLSSYIEVSHTVAVDTQHQTIMSIRDSDNTVQIYALEIEPNKFGPLSATPGNYDRYHDEALSITVLGEQDEPIEGIEVFWELNTIVAGFGGVNVGPVNQAAVNSGASFTAPKGKISPASSITNSAGVATATYCPPGIDWVLNDAETITTRVYI